MYKTLEEQYDQEKQDRATLEEKALEMKDQHREAVLKKHNQVEELATEVRAMK